MHLNFFFWGEIWNFYPLGYLKIKIDNLLMLRGLTKNCTKSIHKINEKTKYSY
jgi:hypothetical protein